MINKSPIVKSSVFGWYPCCARFCLGNSASQTQETENQNQVAAEEGAAVGANARDNTLNVTTFDPEVADAALSANSTIATTALNDVSASDLDAEEIAAGEVDQAATTYAQQSELQSQVESQALNSAETIAANAAPQSTAAEREILSGTSPLASTSTGAIPTSYILVAIGLIGLLFTLHKTK